MKKSINIWSALTIAAALTAGFTACTNEDNLQEEQIPGTQSGKAPTYTVNIQANFGGPETRAVEPGEGGKLVSKFRTSDNIFVYNKTLKHEACNNSGDKVYLHADANASKANLTGALTFWKYGKGYQTVSEGDDLQLIYNNNGGDLDYSLEHQPGTLEGLNTWDYATAEVTVTGVSGTSEGGYTLTTTDANFVNPQSMYKFIFTGMPSGVGVREVTIHSAGGNLVTYYNYCSDDEVYHDITINLESESDCDGYATSGYERRQINNQGAEEGQNIVYAALRFKEIAANATDEITFTVEATDDNIYIATKTSPVGGFKNSKYYTSTIQLTKLGKFKINNSGYEVVFAPGNLQATWDGTSWSWGFAANQWDYIGNAAGNTSINGNGTISGTGTVDLFGWVGVSNSKWSGKLGTTGNAAMHGISNSTKVNFKDTYGDVAGEALKSDWGNTIGSSWRTLTKDEWVYIFNTRESGSTVNGITDARYTHATINTDNGTDGVNGMILFPEGINVADGEATSWGRINSFLYDNGTWADATKCTSAQWTALAAKGCVFLPAAGYRQGAEVYGAGLAGSYWSSTSANYYRAFEVNFDMEELIINFDIDRPFGNSVRLVRDM